jgi:hypothetical protein
MNRISQMCSFTSLTNPTTPILVNFEVEVEENLRAKIREYCMINSDSYQMTTD